MSVVQGSLLDIGGHVKTQKLNDISFSILKEQTSCLVLSQFIDIFIEQKTGEIDRKTITVLFGISYLLTGISENLVRVNQSIDLIDTGE